MTWAPWKNRWNLIKRIRKEKVPEHMKKGRPKQSWDHEEEMLVQCASMMPKTETSGEDAAEE